MFYESDRCHICVKMLKVINLELTRSDKEGARSDPQVSVKRSIAIKPIGTPRRFRYLPKKDENDRVVTIAITPDMMVIYGLT